MLVGSWACGIALVQLWRWLDPRRPFAQGHATEVLGSADAMRILSGERRTTAGPQNLLESAAMSANAHRLPPGQYEARGEWPVLHFGDVPVADLDAWRFRIHGAVETERVLTLDEFRSLPAVDLRADFHCVTKFSVFDNDWHGVRPAEVLRLVDLQPGASHVMVEALEGYTANLPLDVFDDEDTLFAWRRNGEDLTPDHGWPLRLVIPKRYAWKSVKWVNGLEVLVGDRRGFWEERGYHNRADPWNEERYSYQETG